MLWQQKGGEVDHTGEWSEEVPLKGQHVRLWGLFCLLVNCFFFRILRLNFEKSKKFSPSSIPGTEHLCWVETTAGTLLYHAPAEAFLGDWGTPATPRAGLNREQQKKKHEGTWAWRDGTRKKPRQVQAWKTRTSSATPTLINSSLCIFPCPAMTFPACALWFSKTGSLVSQRVPVVWCRHQLRNCIEPRAWVWGPTPLCTMGSVWPWLMASLLWAHISAPCDSSQSADIATDKWRTGLSGHNDPTDASPQVCFQIFKNIFKIEISLLYNII